MFTCKFWQFWQKLYNASEKSPLYKISTKRGNSTSSGPQHIHGYMKLSRKYCFSKLIKYKVHVCLMLDLISVLSDYCDYLLFTVPSSLIRFNHRNQHTYNLYLYYQVSINFQKKNRQLENVENKNLKIYKLSKITQKNTEANFHNPDTVLGLHQA